ncbi:McrB family protein [Flavicella sediminum]|uniref:McrB family protein n=1 Tax=Flavicella sediminum TaxID=2585141 RepID=UPI00111DC48C|nr:AAA family ATPase [Flavicella sediminum]
MINYSEYESQVYTWLQEKREVDPNFTFSVRKRASKGAEGDYFIGTLKSRYFSTTFWNIPTSYPGASGDCISLIFDYRDDFYGYTFELIQTNSPEDAQNTAVLNLVKSLQEKLAPHFSFSHKADEGQKIFTLKTKQRQEKYTVLNGMLNDVAEDLKTILLLVDEAILEEKGRNKELKAARISVLEFEEMQTKLKLRRNKNKTTVVSDHDKLVASLQKIGYTNAEFLYKNISLILKFLSIQEGDQKVCYNLTETNIVGLTIGQRYVLTCEPKKSGNLFGYLDASKPSDWYIRTLETSKILNNFDAVLSDAKKELIKTKKSGYLEHSSRSLEKIFFSTAFKKEIFSEAFPLITSKPQMINVPLNQIFYGPPGTGKTYNTILEAAKIIEQDEALDYKNAQIIFNKNLGDRVEFITFHQNYSYEDFIQGLRPDTELSGELSFFKSDGVFKRIADRALKNLKDSENPDAAKKEFHEVFSELIAPLHEGDLEELEIKMKQTSFYITEVGEKSIEFRKNQGDSVHTLSINTLNKMYANGENNLILGGLQPYYNPILNRLLENGKSNVKPVEKQNYVIVIDEINRANISRVFGELITLIEKDKRSHGAIPLSATLPSGEKFIVPSNLYIIGTMNTADKSIALLDIALRRRFEFRPMYPKYNLPNIHKSEFLKTLNEAIVASGKGHDFTIGHSYFMCGENESFDFEKTINNKVIPLLLEYYMNDEIEVKKILNEVLKAEAYKVDNWPLEIIAND